MLTIFLAFQNITEMSIHFKIPMTGIFVTFYVCACFGNNKTCKKKDGLPYLNMICFIYTCNKTITMQISSTIKISYFPVLNLCFP